MRRAQTQRHAPRPSGMIALSGDELGVLREGNETNEDVLRRQLLEKDRECDRLATQVQTLLAQLAARPKQGDVEALEKEARSLDLLLQGTQRENERAMAELERQKTREKMLENALAKFAGPNWQDALDLPSLDAANVPATPSKYGKPGASASPSKYANPNATASPSKSSASAENPTPAPPPPAAQLSQLEQVRLLVLGMEQRLRAREEKLEAVVRRAEGEGARYEAAVRAG
ncbi:uncharacterized protein SCHCODRAFT_02644213 [Schizophyllum commune H4-8]|uniref:uncharacterized protein n=1 Tax=Schizophyllum commune (strain H4-8 / FGSC 9210) TaxID=578458 RepID=UPI00215EDCCD|nr:uncharacterized protein SCHCODRAFT_02644213 [Schizophyllum commune H4-8]KAI5885246.1 hypothetical protein SCHCODRAFT_02644213 [Schizophyllum commune H4-8]